ncbi:MULTISPECIES: mechanosensitive ion channel family protein [Enterococcus]|uniref:Mechanosensitive ion channel protein MscS n=1 Tax=Enterococcus thailandicus TaxID=417368 RepID=A0A179ETM4_ENTTH|nr:mechanosensitive ion channel family protein [Enterococcus thailandicus]MDA3965630.1 mechanosensitive ion channel family protein [Enterococcus thailandicus]MDK4350922.1 mechanosensitive ion channel family protein [Enterococcus thailandicus]MDT2733424.1 mechanosensitive ion channel family protein [Enterococcus thailandicus]MDT2750579.1 mechanosensitive ion channel family protein [Enterococcus thailandicus]MDT2775138.1 mechanosensitive ion channel family protein [Enterococcus thailandicus]
MYLAQITETKTSSSETITDQAVQQVNAFQRFWNEIDWDAILATFIEKTLYLIFLVILFSVLSKIGKYLLDKSFSQYSKKASLNESRLKTLHSLLHTIFHYTLGFFFIYALLSVIGVPIGSLLAGAGIAGVAIGLGAQGFMNDMITGFFIIMEQQMDVGDYIQLANLSIEGTVVSVGIRTLQLKATDGTVHYIPNRNITTISNLSRANMLVRLDIRIVPEEGYDKIQAVIQQVNQQLAEKYQNELQTEPTIFGLVDLGNSNFAIRTICYALNGKQHVLKEEFLSAYVQALTTAGFTIPNTPVGTVG